MADRAQVSGPLTLVTTVVVLAVALMVGVAVVDTAAYRMDLAQHELHERAEAVYGDDYVIVSSAACYETCAPTATTPAQQRADLLRALQRDRGWVDEITLTQATPGYDLDARLDELVDAGLVERRHVEGILPRPPEYRVTDSTTQPAHLTDDEVDRRVRRRLYLTGGSMTAGEISADLPVDETRVESSLGRLEDRGHVDAGYVGVGMLGWPSHEYVDVRHGSLPDAWWLPLAPIAAMVSIVIAIAGVLPVVIRARADGEPE